MRSKTDAARLERFLEELGRRARSHVRLYLVGGATAVREGWRPMTVDIDLKLEPETRELYEALPDLKERLDVNVELAAPSDFIPELPGWRTRSAFVASYGKLHVYHYDFVAQLLAKVERDHARDRGDVQAMLDRGLVDPTVARALFAQIEPELVRYPAIDPATFRSRVEAALGDDSDG